MSENGVPDDLFTDLERRALQGLPDEDEADPDVDVIARLQGRTDGSDAADDPGDVTLGGYIEKHDRVPAFEGRDGQPYTVDVEVEQTGSEPAFGAFLIFVRWAETGAGIMDHHESDNVATGPTEAAARQGALDLTLWEVKAALDAAIARKQLEMED